MKIVIIEDEAVAQETLARQIRETEPDVEILAVLSSVRASVEWLSENPSPDLLFMDINLGDGMSFSIFDKVDVECPVIFTTAYDEYALQAFEVNCIDYLLKPVTQERLRRAIGASTATSRARWTMRICWASSWLPSGPAREITSGVSCCPVRTS